MYFQFLMANTFPNSQSFGLFLNNFKEILIRVLGLQKPHEIDGLLGPHPRAVLALDGNFAGAIEQDAEALALLRRAVHQIE